MCVGTLRRAAGAKDIDGRSSRGAVRQFGNIFAFVTAMLATAGRNLLKSRSSASSWCQLLLYIQSSGVLALLA